MSGAECRTTLCRKTVRIRLALSEASASLSKTATESVVLNLSSALSGLVSSYRFGRRLGEHRWWSQSGHKPGPLCKVKLLVIALLVFATAAVFLFAELAFGRRLRVVYAMLHRFCCAKKGEDRLEVVIG